MHETFLTLTLLSCGAAALAAILQRLGLSPILGYLGLGVAMAPFKEKLFPNAEVAPTLAEIGIILLLFFLGLEFHLDEARKKLREALIGGGAQIVLCTLAGAGAGLALGLTPQASIVIGLALAFSSTALVMKVYEDRGQTDGPHARGALVVLLVQDLAVILVVALLPFLGGQSADGKPQSYGALAAKLGVLVLVVPMLFWGGRTLLPWAFNHLAKRQFREAFTLCSLASCMVVALVAEFAGASPSLGAFLGGLVLCDTPFSTQIRSELITLKNLALAFFFVSVGMLLDASYLVANLHGLALFMVLAVLVKLAFNTLAIRMGGTPWALAAGVGLALSQIGEFSFVLAKVARGQGLLAATEFKFLLALAIMTMLVTPWMVTLGGKLTAWMNRRAPVAPPAPPVAENPQAEDHAHGTAPPNGAILIGYGPVGRQLDRILEGHNVPVTIVELNGKTVAQLKKDGRRVIFGDAGKQEILEAAGIMTARHLAITLPDTTSRLAVAATARMLNPDLRIMVRARYLGERALFEELGCQMVAVEEEAVGQAMSRFMLRELGVPEPEIVRETQPVHRKTEILHMPKRPKKAD